MDAKCGADGKLRQLLNVAACTIALSTTMGHDAAVAQQTTLTPRSTEAFVAAMSPVDLEKAFWVCDYTATVAGVHATPVALCAAVWEEIKQTRFGGSFDDLLAWWQSNKSVEHEALASAAVAYRGQD